MTRSKSPTWSRAEWTIQEFISRAGTVDMNPVGQRDSVESRKREKSKAIMRSVFEGGDICEIALRHMDKNKPAVTHEYRSIDGGHRKRAIWDFINNKFRLPYDLVVCIGNKEYDISELAYGELPTEVQEYLLNYTLRLVIYDKSTTDAQAGYLFRLRNKSTQVNFQEMLNSFEDNLVAKLVRETARAIPQLNNVPHSLFVTYFKKKDEEQPVLWQVTPSRLLFDEFVARFLCVLLKDNGVQTASNDELENMYITLGDPENGEWVKNPALAADAAKKLKAGLNFIQKYAETRKKQANGAGLTLREAVMLTRIYAYLEKEFSGSWKIADFDVFYSNFKPALDDFVGAGSKNGLWVNEIVWGDRTKAEAMKGFLGEYGVLKKITDTVEWLQVALEKHYVPLEMLIVIKDKNRSISRDLLETIWIKQGKKCDVTQKPLNFADAVAGHIKAHSEGGSSTVDNIVAIHKDINAKMGTMNLEDFKRAYWIAKEEMV